MSFVLSTFETACITLLAAVAPAGTRFAFSHQNAPRPQLPFVSLQVLGMTPAGEPEEIQSSGDNHTVTQWDSLSLQVKTVGGGSLALAQTLRKGFGLRAIVDGFGKIFAGVAQISSIQNVPVAQGNGWEDQSVFDVAFNIVSQNTEAVGYISSVNIDGDIGDQSLAIGE